MKIKIQEKAFAKINPGLDVIKRRSDGYHELRMIMQTIELHDDIYIEETRSNSNRRIRDGLGEIDLVSDAYYVSDKTADIAYKAAKLFFETFDITTGVSIRVEKHIPVAAGMAGGSSDAAAVLRGLNRLYDMHLKCEELQKLGVSLGADVPYCIEGGTMLAEGIGDRLTPLPALPKLDVVIAKPDIAVSTKYVYDNLHVEDLGQSEHPDMDKVIAHIKAGDARGMCREMSNILERVTAEKYNIIDELKQEMLQDGACGSIMSGSGPTVFGIFDDAKIAEETSKKLQERYKTKITAIHTRICNNQEELR